MQQNVDKQFQLRSAYRKGSRATTLLCFDNNNNDTDKSWRVI
jgi:hypothetical protein